MLGCGTCARVHIFRAAPTPLNACPFRSYVLSPVHSLLNHQFRILFREFISIFHGRSGHLFQGRFASEPVDDDEYLTTKVRYIHQNPVKSKMAPDCSYKWGSYNAYVSGRLPAGGELVMGIFLRR